jgi:A/G-specific adenine glycosylase
MTMGRLLTGSERRIYATPLTSGSSPVGSPILPLVTGTIPRQPATRLRFNRRLFRWHDSGRRPLVIREAATPWQVLVAEVMSQQTGIERVGPAWRRFIERWPTPADLAAAGTHELLAAWAGLGYNRRALALREAARAIVAVHGGRVPGTVEALERLPGVGPYTARAVAAAAFGVPVAPLDVNTRRVVSRVLGVSPSWPGLQAAADDLVSRGRPGRWLDAVMDLAIATCTRRAPRCDRCPLEALCASRGSVAVEAARRGVPFPATTRWLRGRLLAAVTRAPTGSWVPLPERLGQHDADAIDAAARGLERDGFLDLRTGAARVRE